MHARQLDSYAEMSHNQALQPHRRVPQNKPIDHKVDDIAHRTSTEEQAQTNSGWKQAAYKTACVGYGAVSVTGCYFAYHNQLTTIFTNMLHTSALVAVLMALFFNLFAVLTPTYSIRKSIKVTALSCVFGLMLNGFLSGLSQFVTLEGHAVYYIIAALIPFSVLCKSSGYSLFSSRVFI